MEMIVREFILKRVTASRQIELIVAQIENMAYILCKVCEAMLQFPNCLARVISGAEEAAFTHLAWNLTILDKW